VSLTGDFAGLRKLGRGMVGLAAPGGAGNDLLLAAVSGEVKGLLKEQFAQGTDPSGDPLELTKRGQPALVSKKLPGAFTSRIDQGAVRFFGRVGREWLDAHQLGHSFPPRAGGGQSLFFNESGHLLRLGALSKRGLRTKFVSERVARQHVVGRRVLPKREMYPAGGLTPRWSDAIERGLVFGMYRWYERQPGQAG
jgi:hypothetical protein